MGPQIRDDRQMRALTGLSNEKLTQLEATFAQVYHQRKQTNYESAKASGKRKRRPGGGRKGALPTIKEKLIFLLYYLKVYPTYDVLGAQFGMARSKACENVHKLFPILLQTLVTLEVLPARKFATVEEFRATFSDIDQILIDVTERAYRRHTDDSQQREKYSGKKRRHTVKNTIIATPDKVVKFIGITFCGRHHDYTMLKTELPPDKPWFADIAVTADLGYQGIATNYQGEDIQIPHKKPRKSKANPNPQLTDEQKAFNRALSKRRIIVENAICGIKRYNILNYPYRNRNPNSDDDVIAISAGLWNFLLAPSSPVI